MATLPTIDITAQIRSAGNVAVGGTLADPILYGVYDKDGKYIADTGDDNSGLGRNALKLFTPDAAGTYYVAARGQGTGTYTVAVTEGVAKDDHAASATLATVEMSKVKVAEGGKVAFTVSLSEAATGAVTVQWSVSGAVTAGDDYTGTAGPFTLSFAAGETKKTVEIQTVNDTVSEDDEALTVTLSNPTGAVLGTTASATVTITDDDPKVTDAPPVIPVGQQTADDDEPEVSIADVTVTEGGTATLTLALSKASSGEVVVYWSSADGTAGSGDYTGSGTAQKVVFAAGEVAKEVLIATAQDDVDEPDEAFSVALSSPEGAVLGTKASATVTIEDDEGPPPLELTQAGGVVLRGTQGADRLTGTDRADRLEGLAGRTG